MKPVEQGQSLIALGLMSGTSLDGIDVALVETNGTDITDIGPSLSVPYTDQFRDRLKAAVEMAGLSDVPVSDQNLINEITDHHIGAVQKLLGELQADHKWGQPDVVGFHGHTTLHRPNRRFTQQIGDSERLARAIGIPVVSEFRQQDVKAGGQGAPLVPVFHRALCEALAKPMCFVNIGGISNVTWIGENPDELVAFDTGTGNGLLDAWVEQNTGRRFDAGGELAAQGRVDSNALESLLENPFFKKPYPKSLDRSDFNLDRLEGLSPSDGAATLVSFAISSILLGLEQCPSPPLALYVTGGGRHNKTMMNGLEMLSPCPVYPVEKHDWNGDFIEAQAFAFLAARSLQNLPITFPGTTGVSVPMPGGKTTNL